MLSYETAKRLKDAGFPQGRSHFNWSDWTDKPTYWCENVSSKLKDFDKFPVYDAPTLSELIESVGELYILAHEKSEWVAQTDGKYGRVFAKGLTPEEAVAALYLALHEQK